MTPHTMHAKRNTYRVSLTPVAADTDIKASLVPVEFIHHNHDDVAHIVGLVQASSGLDAEPAAALAVGLKLLAQTVLDHKDNPLFDGMRQPLRDFIQALKSHSATAST
jgi:hypothetical protein